ncbi:MAG: hypothetical protein ACFCUX_03330 [Candidatus Methylacidiphilales bacterium]
MQKKFLAVLAALFSVMYLLNPGAGWIEFIPDNIPVIGNLDEAAFTAMLIWAISVLRGREMMGHQDPLRSAKPAQKVDPHA